MFVPPRFPSVVAMMLITAATARSQSYTDLVFDTPVQATNASHSQVGRYYQGTTYDFLNVGQSGGQNIDMRMSVSGVTYPRYTYQGTAPDYSGAAGTPTGDLGVLFTYNGGAGPGGDFGSGGLTYTLEFFRSGSNFTDPFAIPDFRLMIYDVDGESTQDEAVAAFADDGLASYQLFNNSDIAVVDSGDGYHLFNAPGITRDEADPRTALILGYHNTNSIRLQIIANTKSNSSPNNGVFIAIDGDLSSLATGTLAAPVYLSVPEPSSAALLLLAVTGLTMRRKRAT